MSLTIRVLTSVLLACLVLGFTVTGQDTSEQPSPARVDLYGDPLPPGALVRMGTIRLRIIGHWNGLDFLTNGKTLVSGSTDRIQFWDIATGKEIRRIVEPDRENYLQAIALSPDGKLLAAAGDKTIRLWDVMTGQEVQQFRGGSIRSLALTPDGKTLITGGSDFASAIQLWDVATGKERARRLWHQREVSYLAVTPDGRVLISVGQKVHFADLATLEEIRTLADPHWNFVRCAALSPEGKILAVAGRIWKPEEEEIVGFLQLFEVATGKELRRFEGSRFSSSVHAVAFSPDGRTVASTDYAKTLHFWDVATGKEVRKVEGLRTHVGRLVFSPDGQILAGVGSGSTILLWDVATGKQLHAHPGHEGYIHTVAISPDGKLLASASWDDDTVHLWDLATGKHLQVLPHERYIRSVVFSADGKSLISCGGDSFLRRWDVTTGQVVRQYELEGEQQVLSMGLSADGRQLICTSAGLDGESPDATQRLTIWDLASGERLLNREDRLGWSVRNRAAFSPDLTKLARIEDKGFAISDIGTGRELLTLKPAAFDHFAFSPDGKLLAVSSSRQRQEGSRSRYDDFAVRLFDLGTGKELHKLSTPGWIPAVAFSPDGRRLAAASEDGFFIWDVTTGEEILHRDGLDAHIQSLAFSPDGRRLATGLQNATVLICDLAK